MKGVLFNKSKTRLIAYPAAKKGRKYSVPKSVKQISIGAFDSCNNLRELTMKDGVTRCDELFGGSFYNMRSLRKIRLSKNLIKVESRTFTECSKLQQIRIPDKVKSIGVQAFAGCKSLKSITLGKNVEEIAIGAFEDCPNLRKIVFRSKVWTIPNEVIFRDTGKNNYGKLAVYVPKKWKKEKKLIREWFRDEGLSEKAKIKFY